MQHTHITEEAGEDPGSTFFSLKVDCQDSLSLITIHFKNPPYSTHGMKHVIPHLEKTVPHIFKAKCYNGNKLPFRKEVTKTELGHLYEHILLEYLLLLSPRHQKELVFKGDTSWNWIENPKGLFTIEVSVGISQKELLLLAIQKTNNVIENLLLAHFN